MPSTMRRTPKTGEGSNINPASIQKRKFPILSLAVLYILQKLFKSLVGEEAGLYSSGGCLIHASIAALKAANKKPGDVKIITIDGNTLSFQSFTAHGELYDAFDLEKRKGKPNKLVNRIPDTRERL
jgi:uncharacterized ParB-like nuclease family protein